MESRLPQPRQIRAQLQALGDEIRSIREEHYGHIIGLNQRLQEAEDRQQQLRHQLNVAMDRSPEPLGDNHIDSRIHEAGYSPLPERPSVGYRGPPSRRLLTQLEDLHATPRPHRSFLHPNPDGPPSQQEQQAPTGSRDNAAYLPMVMENIMFERQRHERHGTLRSCGFVLGEGRSGSVRCSEKSFHMPCFRAHHFYYCRKHIRVVPAPKRVCSHSDNQDCLVVMFEDHDDWDAIVDAAHAANNLGSKGIDPEELKEALFPPRDYPRRYMDA